MIETKWRFRFVLLSLFDTFRGQDFLETSGCRMAPRWAVAATIPTESRHSRLNPGLTDEHCDLYMGARLP